MSTLPPGPKGIFPLGNVLQLAPDWMGFCTQCVRQYGDTVLLRFLRIPICLVANPEGIESVLVTNYANFIKSRDYRAMEPMMGKGLLTNEGDSWKKQRKLIQPAFNHDEILRYAQIMVDRGEEMLATWRDGETRDLHQEMMRLTLQIAAQSLFGADVSAYAERVSAALKVAMEQFTLHASLALLVPLHWKLPQTPSLRRAVSEFDRVVSEIIAKRRTSGKKEPDLLQMLLDARDADGNPMPEQQLRDELRTLLLAGHETTAAALSWTWYLLAQHPEIEGRLQEELTAVLAGRPPRADDLRQLRYTEMVIKESMRLYPPAWSVGRQALQPFDVNGYHLPAGMYIFISQWITQRDPRFFPRSRAFRSRALAGRSGAQWQGSALRLLSLRRWPPSLHRRRFRHDGSHTAARRHGAKIHHEPGPGHTVEPLASVTLRPKHGIKVVLRRRVGDVAVCKTA